jgi:hypothetical protein
VFYRLLIERAVRSALAAFLAVVSAAAASPNLSVPTAKAALISGVAAAVSAVITVLSQFVGDPTSTSFLPGAPGGGR